MTTTEEQYLQERVEKIAALLEDVARQCRSDRDKLEKSKVEAVLDTVAEGVLGLRTALKHYEVKLV